MHPNPIFRKTEEAKALAFATDRAFGILTVNGAEGPLAAHVPYVLSKDGKVADLHLMRSNPLNRALEAPVPALLAVSGPDGYVSPDWYGIDDQVPTWNYIAVHLRGRLERLPDMDLADVLERMSDTFEARLAPKTPWRIDKVSRDVQDRLMRMIVPVRFTIDSIDSTWKLGQNKPGEARTGAADALTTGFGHELAALAGMMRE